MDRQSKINKLLIRSAYIIVVILIIAVIFMLILKYCVEGETNMPFKIQSMIVISNAEGYQEKENEKYRWDFDIYQNNDIYLNIEKNRNYKKSEAIKNIVIDNIKVDTPPKIGNIEVYRTSQEEKNMFDYNSEYLITEKIEFNGSTKSDLKNLKISNQGGTIILRIANKTGKRYTSNEEEFEHNGKILNRAGILFEDIKGAISLDITINLESEKSFKANMKIEIPVGDITKEGSSSIEITDIKKFVFKRE